MNKFVKIINLAIKNPGRIKLTLDLLRGAKIYMNITVARTFRPLLLPIEKRPNRGITIDEFMKENNFTNRYLLNEFLTILKENGYLKIQDNFLFIKKEIKLEELNDREKKIPKILREAFENFAEYFPLALLDRLKGKPPEEFDSNELRVLWNVALRGDFYSLQRIDALKIASLDKLAKECNNTPIRILDFGCGSGEGTLQILNFLREKNIPHILEACDVSEGLLEIAKEDEGLEEDIYFFNFKEQKPKKNYYNAIFISQVLHWPEDAKQMIAELQSYLKEDGIIFGVQSIFSKRIYAIDLFIRILGAKGFPKEEELYQWFNDNDMTIDYYPVTYTFVARKKK